MHLFMPWKPWALQEKELLPFLEAMVAWWWTSLMNFVIWDAMSRIIKIKKRSFIKRFYAINLFGIIITCEKLSKESLNHELIHTAQAKELLYVLFYIWYIAEWSVLVLKYRNWMKAYYNIRFEKEAYAHQNDMEYLIRRKHYCYLTRIEAWHI